MICKLSELCENKNFNPVLWNSSFLSVESTFLSQIPYEKDRRYIKIHEQWFGLQTYFHISLLTPDIVQNYLPSLTALLMCVYKYVHSNDCYVVYNHIIYVYYMIFM